MTKGQKIKFKRKQCGLSQTDLAAMIGVSKQTLYKYENDIITNIPSNIIERLAFELEISPAYLMGWQNEQPHNEIDEIVTLLRKLSPDNLKGALRYIKFLAEQEGETET